MDYRKKLIEVALPLEAINKEAAREKSIRHGHPCTLHLWWARRPLAACRAVLFSSLVDDPSAWPELFPTEKAQEVERLRLFAIIEELVKWENLNNDRVISAAQGEIARSIARNNGDELPKDLKSVRKYLAEKAPPVLDPFCGGGSIPLEAQRLGLRAYGSDLNPVAVLITKALIEIPPKFAGKPPVHPKEQSENTLDVHQWRGAQGLAEDVSYYGKWMREEAEKRIGKYYPKVKITKEMVKERPDLKRYEGQELTVIAWLWARTVKCPNPGCKARTPLVRSFWLSKKGNICWAKPVLDDKTRKVKTFEIVSKGEPLKHTTDRTGARCMFCETFIKKPQLREISVNDGTTPILLAIVAEGKYGRVYLSGTVQIQPIVKKPEVSFLEQPITNDRRWFSPPLYGMPNFADLFTSRQLIALTTFSDLVQEAHKRILTDAKQAGVLSADDKSLDEKGSGAMAYADAVATYLGEAVSKSAAFNCTLANWRAKEGKSARAFGRQAMPMVWDYTEINPFADAGGSWIELFDSCLKTIQQLPARAMGASDQLDVTKQRNGVFIVSTDPPYYDNIGYSDLSDFYYFWLRRSLKSFFPNIFSTLKTPKAQELIASSLRFEGNEQKAKEFFESGLAQAFRNIQGILANNFPVSIYYAFKQTEEDNSDESESNETIIASTGWETMLEGLIQAQFHILGTWPMRTESVVGLKNVINALATSVVLVCRQRPSTAPLATRKDFISSLQKELPAALRNLQHGNIAPVDLAQASIGPGMAIFSRYSKVLEADGSSMSVRTALQLINQELDAYLSEQEGELDRDTRFCIDWFTQYSINEGPFGEADTLGRAKNTSVQGLVEAGIAYSKAGKVRLLQRSEYPDDWDPATDSRLTVWECTQHLIRTLEKKGEAAAAQLAAKLGGRADDARALAYRLYSICERKGWAQEALSYNSLVIAWPEIMKLARETGKEIEQTSLF